LAIISKHVSLSCSLVFLADVCEKYPILHLCRTKNLVVILLKPILYTMYYVPQRFSRQCWLMENLLVEQCWHYVWSFAWNSFEYQQNRVFNEMGLRVGRYWKGLITYIKSGISFIGTLSPPTCL
jgi:hypothetical protein